MQFKETSLFTGEYYKLLQRNEHIKKSETEISNFTVYWSKQSF